MTKELIIIALILALIYLYYQNRQKPNLLTSNGSENSTSELTSFLKDHLNANSLEELKSKLGEKSLDELLEQNEDYETEVDTLTRNKNSLEVDLLAQSNSFQNRLREKDREIKKLKERLEQSSQDLASEKQQHKGSIGRITKLTEQIQSLEKETKTLRSEIVKAEQLNEFWTWLQENKDRQASLKDWEHVINFLQTQQRNYYLVEGNWSEGWTKSNKDHYRVFQTWLKTKNNTK